MLYYTQQKLLGGFTMTLDFSHDGYEDLFRNALRQGINLFCGAGFSVESSDQNGVHLPVGIGLLTELKEKFPAISNYSNLPRACTKIIKTDKQSFYSFLKERFSVTTFAPEYAALTKVKIKSIYTTNIDDLFFKIFEQSESPFLLNDCSVKGTTYNDALAVNYFPLHGCVRNSSDYVFGATEIASAFSQRGNEKSWKHLAIDAAKHPILFWGWNFEDAGPIEAMYGNENAIDNNTNRWVLLRNPTEETIDYIKALKFNIIIGDTRGMLEYISNFIKSSCENNIDEPIGKKASKFLKKYEIPPNDEKLPSYPLQKFFLEYTPSWSHIYSHTIPKTTNYKKVENSIASGINTIVMGIRGSGKTTLMMQLLVDFNTDKLKHLLIAPSLEDAQIYLKILNGAKSLVFIDDCFRDTNALILLLQSPNVQVVGFDRDFNYERQYHQIRKFIFNPIDITEITPEDAQSIVNIIPTELQRPNAGTKNFEKDPTILNLLAKNLKSVNFTFIQDFHQKDEIAAKVFIMIAYFHSCGTPCSFDMVYSFLGDDKYTWQEMYDIVNRAGGLVKDASDWFCEYNIMDAIQDYYQCRSRFLAEKIIDSIPKGNRVFKEVLSEFTTYVPAYKICQYDKFKRSAYDADLASRAFPNIQDGIEFYQLSANKDESEYIYQQAAIYFSRNGDYKKAFNWIEKARNLSHYNRFSIDSTHAKIYFDVNLSTDQEQAKTALDTLSACCKNDKRKSIHFSVFAKCCIAYHKEYGGVDYLDTALSYIKEGLDDTNLSLSKNNKLELQELGAELEKYIRESSCN